MATLDTFEQYIFDEKNLTPALKNHTQLPCIIDSLSRSNYHHLALISTLSNKIHQALMAGLAKHFLQENIPKILRDYKVAYLNANDFIIGNLALEEISKTLTHLTEKPIIFAIDQIAFLANQLVPFIMQILANKNWRVIVFAPQKNNLDEMGITQFFATMPLTMPQPTDQLTLLKNYCIDLENFHHVIIPDEIITNAYNIAGHYLPGNSIFNKTLELLDSAAANAQIGNSHSGQKIFVTDNSLAQVVANRTQIPLSHLNNNKFQAQKFTDSLKKHIFGQDAALNLMASLLQNACIKLQNNNGPLCSFLLVGSHDVGKTALAYAIAEHLLGNHTALLRVQPNQAECVTLSEIKIIPNDTYPQEISLLAAIQQMPYAIILIENIEEMPLTTLHLLQNLFEQEYVLDEKNNQYDFRHTIIIATTRRGSPQLGKSIAPQEVNKTLDLTQIVLNQRVSDTTMPHTSIQELCEELMPKLAECLPANLLQAFNIIPLIPLDYSALEKIIRLKIKLLGRRLYNSFGIELRFASEVVKFLAHEATWRKENSKQLDKLLERHLYSTVTHEILLRAEDKNRTKCLLIQLNDSGQLLRCEFIHATDAALYNV